MSKELQRYLKKVIGRKTVYTLTPYSRIRWQTRKSKNRRRQADSEYGQGDSNDHVHEFLEEEIQDLVSAVQVKIDSLDKKCCDGCSSCRDAAPYHACKLDFRKGKRNSWSRMKRKQEKMHYSQYHEDLRRDDSDHYWRLRMRFSREESCVHRYDDDESNTMSVDIHVPRAYHLIRILQLLSLPRCHIENLPEEITHTVSTALAGPYRQLDNRNSQVSHLRVIECHDIQITLPTMQTLHNILVQSESLEQLHLNHCYFTETTEGQLPFEETTEHRSPFVQLLGDGLANAKSTQFKVLRLSTCYFTYANIAHLISQLLASERYHQLETLNLEGNFVDQETLTTLASWLEQPMSPLRSLDLSACSPESPLDLSPLRRALEVQSRRPEQLGGGGLRRLNLGFNILSDDGVQLLADALKQKHQPLQIPVAVNNSHTTPAAAAVNGLKSLSLATNRSGHPQTITCRGLQYLGEGLTLCHSLQFLDVSYARFDPAALNAFCNGLAANESITELRIQRLRFAGFPEEVEDHAATGVADWISIWGGTHHQLPHDQHGDLIAISPPTTAMEYLCLVLVAAMPQLKSLDISYSIGLPTFFYENISQMKELEELCILGYTSFMAPSDASGTFDDSTDQALIRGVSKSTNITKVYGLDGARCWTAVDYYVRLNRRGRKYLDRWISSSLWPRVLERANQQPDVLHHLLREGAVSIM
mmetsp:Transcript_24494/g.60003  ORF Transcript_24494/g.60003 Transcript_24494/m.60003 type:complete len:702 (-) Transcript_24494:1434-3539(-)